MSDATNASSPPRDLWVMAGMLIAAASAAVASFTGLRGLALITGWPTRLAWLLPVTLDAYAMTSARVWLASTTRARRARRFARANAIGAIAASIAGNATYHSVTVGLMHITPPIVVLVGAVPAAVLGFTAHLHALRTLVEPEDVREDEPEDGAAPAEERPQVRTRSKPKRRPRPRTEDELRTAARDADTAYRAAHDGRSITRDELRTVLKISGTKATELRRWLAAEGSQPESERPTA
ncbi:DUF2637 domain-containing protein [Actinospica sp. MGRD01-02]|uniref:DUF2637 domain-containing protein n=1 Tax=Actinospica acidithermotolerans TaxID=2828514 RepID=A0A941EGL0_9ACTN|nr:DUF2637 domain-containing protein [Actinospica acidithermotolerans]MBR7830245.1 DUF2637 domain-containing protein [Actinospica acidithermotolerans]